jgi:probable F420-dependent oxidoreductase
VAGVPTPDVPAIPLDLLLSGDDLGEVARFARAAEAAGFARLWAPELHRSATVPLAVAAGATERIELATGIALAFTRSPMVLALEALDLDELSGGRLVLGLGAGVRRLNQRWHGAAYDPPVARMRELVAAVRELLRALAAGDDAHAPGRRYDIEVRGLRLGRGVPRGVVPVWLAAVLPGMTRLAGAVADGFLDHPVTTPDWLREVTVPALEEGAGRAGRARPAVAGALICAVDDADPAAARRAAAATVGFYATVRTYEPLFAGHGFGDRLPAIRRAHVAGDIPALVEAVGEDMTARFAAAGTAAQARARAGDYSGLADRLWLTPPHHGQDGAAQRRWQEGILRAFGRAAG